MKALATALVIASAAIASVSACSSPDANARVNADLGLHDRATFEPVSRAMVYKCGSLDCHGTMYRNLRLFGYGGLRKSKADFPEGAGTKDDEVEANYQAIAGLEPEKFKLVVEEGGRQPERLALVAKPRSLQNHKGGPVMTSGDPIDVCITSWLAKNVDSAACLSVVPEDAGIPLPASAP